MADCRGLEMEKWGIKDERKTEERKTEERQSDNERRKRGDAILLCEAS